MDTNRNTNAGVEFKDFIPGAKEERKEGNVLFNDALNNFIYDYVASCMWDHSDSERGRNE